jgi:lysozyme family protein
MSGTTSDPIDNILAREDRTGTGVVTNDPDDSGGETQWGLTRKDNPKEWADGVVTREEAYNAFFSRYGAPFKGIEDTNLFHQLVDFGVNAGPETAAKVLQQVLGVKADGQIGPKTIQAVLDYPKGTLFGVPVPGFVLLNLAVRDARILFYVGITKRWTKNLKFLLGWLKRAMEFK